VFIVKGDELLLMMALKLRKGKSPARSRKKRTEIGAGTAKGEKALFLLLVGP